MWYLEELGLGPWPSGSGVHALVRRWPRSPSVALVHALTVDLVALHCDKEPDPPKVALGHQTSHFWFVSVPGLSTNLDTVVIYLKDKDWMR